MTDRSELQEEASEITIILERFYTPYEAMLWLLLPQPLLDGVTPAHLLRRGETEPILTVLRQLDEGVYP